MQKYIDCNNVTHLYSAVMQGADSICQVSWNLKERREGHYRETLTGIFSAFEDLLKWSEKEKKKEGNEIDIKKLWQNIADIFCFSDCEDCSSIELTKEVKIYTEEECINHWIKNRKSN